MSVIDYLCFYVCLSFFSFDVMNLFRNMIHLKKKCAFLAFLMLFIFYAEVVFWMDARIELHLCFVEAKSRLVVELVC